MTRVLLMTGQPLLTRGLASILGAVAEFEMGGVCYQAAHLHETVAAAMPDILIIDLGCEITFGLIAELRRRVPECKIVLWVSTLPGDLGLQFMRLGVRGILRKSVEPAEMVRSLRNVAAGEYRFEEGIAFNLPSSASGAFSSRERQLMNLLAKGMKNKEIAATLSIADGTVKVYLSKLFRKVGVRDRYELALHGMKHLASEDAGLARATDGGPRSGTAAGSHAFVTFRRAAG